MIPYERRIRIVHELKKREFLSLNELMEIFQDVSASTLRRDLKSLSEDGQIDLIQGGATRLFVSGYFNMLAEDT